MSTELVARNVHKLALGLVNVYFVGDRQGWSLIDTGVPNQEARILAASRELFGDVAPEAIVFTHGHVDHAGSARELAATWNVPILATERELPFLTGANDYPPSDPTVGGFIAFMSRFLPSSGFDLRPHLRVLTELPPSLRDWQVISTPGHTPGHVSFWREDDRVLVAGDAVATCDLQSWLKAPLWVQEVAGPPPSFTPDWSASIDSVEKLAELKPQTIAAGHGKPMSGENVAPQLERLAETLTPPRGRYEFQAPRYDDAGNLIFLPPLPPDRLAQAVMLAGAGVLAASLWRAVKR